MSRLVWLMQMAVRNLGRSRRRNFIVATAITSSFAGILLFGGFVVWIEKYLRASTVYLNQTGHLTIGREGSVENQLTKPKTALMGGRELSLLMAILQSEDEIEMIGKGLQSFALLVKDCRSRGVVLIGRDSAVDRANLSNPEVLRWTHAMLHLDYPDRISTFQSGNPSELAMFPAPDVAKFIRAKAATIAREGCELSSPNSLQLIGRDQAGRVVAAEGIVLGEQSTGLSLLDERTLYLPVDDLQKLLGVDQIATVSVYLKDFKKLPWVWSRLQDKLDKAGLNLKIMPFFGEDVGLYYTGSLNFIGAVAGFFVVLIVMVVSLSLLSLFTMSVTERSSEIGLLLSLGFPEILIIRLFALENLLLSLLSLALGFLSAYGLGNLIYRANIRFAAAGFAGDSRLTIAWEPSVVVLLAIIFLSVIVLANSLVLKAKFRKSLTQLLQEGSTL